MHILLLAAQWHQRLIDQTENFINTFSRWRLWSVNSFLISKQSLWPQLFACFFFLFSHPSLWLFVCYLLFSVNFSRFLLSLTVGDEEERALKMRLCWNTFYLWERSVCLMLLIYPFSHNYTSSPNFILQNTFQLAIGIWEVDTIYHCCELQGNLAQTEQQGPVFWRPINTNLGWMFFS